MALFAVFRQWLLSRADWKRATTYLIAALLVLLTAVVPTRTHTAQAAGLSTSSSCPSQLTLTPTQAPPQKPVYVCGSGFVPSGSKNVEIQLYNRSTNQYQLIKYVTPTNGDVITNFKVPVDPGGKYYVVAYQRSSNIQEQATFTIIGGFQSLNPKKGSDVGPIDPLCYQDGFPPLAGNPTLVQAWGEPASTSYQLEWLNKNNNLLHQYVASGQTTANGMLSASFNVPELPSGTYDLIVLTSNGPGPTVTYYSGDDSCYNDSQPGDGNIYYTWDGVGWDPNIVVSFNFDGSQIWTAATNIQGYFSTSFSQLCPPPGTYPVIATGTINGGQPYTFTYNPPETVGNTCTPPPPASQKGRSIIKHSL